MVRNNLLFLLKKVGVVFTGIVRKSILLAVLLLPAGFLSALTPCRAPRVQQMADTLRLHAAERDTSAREFPPADSLLLWSPAADSLKAAPRDGQSPPSPGVPALPPLAGPDSLATDTTARIKTLLPEHSPRKASLYSAILPGMGQAYNRKYWKIPLIYAGFGAFGYFIGWNNRNYTTSRQAYKDLTDKDPLTESYKNLKQIIYFDLNNPSSVANLKQGLISSQDYYRRNRDLLVIITAAFYGLNIIDASVDAHFFNWDISDDLSFRWEPSLFRLSDKNIFSLNCGIHF